MLRPAIEVYLPAPAGSTDHEVIDAGEEARRTLLDTIALARKPS